MSSSLSYRCNKMKGQPISLLQVLLIILLSRFDTTKGKSFGETTTSRNRPSLHLPDGYFIHPGDNVLAYKINTDKKTWDDAYYSCMNDGGRLAIVDTMDKLRHIRNITRGMEYWLYVGIYKPTSSKDWISVENQRPVPDAPWVTSLMDAYDGPACAILPPLGYALLDTDCKSSTPSICELPIDVNKFTDEVELYTNQQDTTKVGISWEDVPMNQYLSLGEDTSIKCLVKGYPSPTVDWLFNGEVIATNDHYIIEPHGLKIKNVQESDDGIYTCRASVMATGQLDERAIRVGVHTRPRMEESGFTEEVLEGKHAEIMCIALGNPPPKFTWIKSLTQQKLATADRFGVNEDTGILTITNPNRNDTGEYQCKATNVAGEASTVKIIKVIVEPNIIEFLNATAVVQKRFEMRCTAFGRPLPRVSFRKHTADKYFTIGVQRNDDRITLKNTKDDLTGETTAVLTIENLSRSDDGLYECLAQNKLGAVFENKYLTVEFPPSFDSMKKLTYLSWDKRPVNLTCIAESKPNATIRWQFNGQEIPSEDQQIKQMTTGPVSTLSVTPADIRYYGNYKCIASNIHGTREYKFELEKNRRPETVRQSRIKAITATTVTFDLVEPIEQPGFPLRAISVQYKPTVEAWSAALNKTWAIGSSYTVEGLQPETVYDFRFNGENKVGVGDWEATIRQLMPPRPFPDTPKVITKPVGGSDYEISPFSRQFKLRWRVPIDDGEPIDQYRIQYCQITQVHGKWQVTTGSCATIENESESRSNYWLKELEPDTFYRAGVRAHNCVGWSSPGVTQFRTGSDEPLTTETIPVTNHSNESERFVQFDVAYEIYNEYLTHAESRARCIEEGGRLAIVDSFEKNNNIRGILFGGSVHVGVRSNIVNYVNEWVRDHDDALLATIPWAPDNPQPSRCAALRYDGSGLEEILCSDRLQFLCEIPIHR